MGLLDRLRTRVKIPRFSVGIYGKLPCYKEYFFVSCDPAFSELKQRLDRGFNALIQEGHPRPLVCPDRRFFVRMDQHKCDLAGGIWESDDGLRGFPFILAAPLAKKVGQQRFDIFWQSLEQVWQYLDGYFRNLREQPSSTDVYNRVRGVVHQIPPFEPEPWTAEPNKTIFEPAAGSGDGLTVLDLTELSEQAEKERVKSLAGPAKPALILWPDPVWRSQTTGPVSAYLGTRGQEDLRMEYFPRQPGTNPSPASDPEPPTGDPTPPTATSS